MNTGKLWKKAASALTSLVMAAAALPAQPLPNAVQQTVLTAKAAADYVEVGANTTSNSVYLPAYFNYNYSYGEQIYKAEELGEIETIEAVSFFVTGALSGRTGRLYLMDTEKDAFDSKEDAVPLGDLEPVYEGALPFEQTGEAMIALSESYTHDKDKNLMVILVNTTGSYVAGCNFAVYTDPEGSNSSIYKYTDYNPIKPENGVTANNITTQKNRMRFYTALDKVEYVLYANDGTDAIEAESVNMGTVITLSPNSFDRPGYVLSGWNTEANGSGTAFEPSAIVSVTENCAFYAQWEKIPDGWIQIGLQTKTSSYLPLYSFYSYGCTEQIYTADEIGNKNLISGIGWLVKSVSGQINTGVLYLKDTDKNSLSDDIEVLDGAVPVYEGNFDFTETGWAYTDFDSVYHHDPSKNLAVIFINNTGSYNSTADFAVYNGQTGCSVRCYQDSGTVVPSVEFSFTSHSEKNVIRLAAESGVSYQITFKANGGTGNDVTKQVFAGKPYTVPDDLFTRDGQYITGWNTKADGSGESYGGVITTNANLELYAQWAPMYTVTFKPNGAVGADTVQKFAPGKDFQLQNNPYSIINLTFTGWNTKADGTGTAYINGQNVKLNENTVLYAQWALLSASADYDFAEAPEGWTYIDADGDGYTWQHAATNSLSFYSHIPDGDDLNEGTVLTSASYINNIGALTPDNWAVTPAFTVSSADSPIVSLWARGQDASYANEVFAIFAAPTSSVNLDSFDPGVWVQVSDEYTVTGTYTEYFADLSSFKGQTVYVAIRHFHCTDFYWLDIDDVTLPSDNHSFAYSILTLKANTGEGTDVAVAAFKNTENFLSPKFFTKKGYVITSWNTMADGTGTAYAADEPHLFNEALTLYAQWSPCPRITYHANGGKGIDYLQNADSELVTLLENRFTYAGHLFTGWNTAANGTGTAYAAGEQAGFTADTELYAQWAEGIVYGDFTSNSIDSWFTYDADGDGYKWQMLTMYNGSIYVMGNQSEERTPDDWLVAPAGTVSQQGTPTAYLSVYNISSYTEHFTIYVGEEGSVDFDSFDPLQWTQVTDVLSTGTDETGFVVYSADLSAYKGKTIYFAIRHFDSDNQAYLVFDSLTLPFVQETASVPAFRSKNMTLGGAISMNFFVDMSMMTEEQRADSYVEFTVRGGTTRVDYNPDFMNSTGTYYGFTCPLNAISMAEPITAVLHYSYDDGNRSVIEGTVTEVYNAETYLNRSLASDSPAMTEKVKALIRALNDYGYYMQQYLCEAAEVPWTLGVDYQAMQRAYVTEFDRDTVVSELAPFEKTQTLQSDLSKIKMSLILDSDTALSLKIVPADGYSGTVTAKLGANKLKLKKLQNGEYQLMFTDIGADQLGEMMNLTIKTASGTSTCSVSALSYAYATASKSQYSKLIMAMGALYNYYQAADAYKS